MRATRGGRDLLDRMTETLMTISEHAATVYQATQDTQVLAIWNLSVGLQRTIREDLEPMLYRVERNHAGSKDQLRFMDLEARIAALEAQLAQRTQS